MNTKLDCILEYGRHGQRNQQSYHFCRPPYSVRTFNLLVVQMENTKSFSTSIFYFKINVPLQIILYKKQMQSNSLSESS